MKYSAIILVLLLLTGCASAPTWIKPQSYTLGVTAPQLFAGTPAGPRGSNKSIGGTLLVTFPLWPTPTNPLPIRRAIPIPPTTPAPTP